MTGICPVPHLHLGLALPVFLWVSIVMPLYIQRLKQRQFGQYIREDGPQSHHQKAGTPTSGGVVLLSGILAALLFGCFFPELSRVITPTVWIITGVTLVFGLLGFSDDWLKIAKHKNKGVSGYTKLLIQTLVGAALGIYLMLAEHHTGRINVLNWLHLPLGWIYPLYAAFVVTATSNAVNLTDGLDGLAAGTCAVSLLGFAFILHTVSPALSVLACVMAAAVCGFWWFNQHPAKIFMGDTGSLALGGGIATLALAGHREWWLLLLGPIFILEAVSVILQVASFKTTGKRIFKMAPLHHHFELCGFSEQQVVWAFIGFQLLTTVLAISAF